MENIEIKKKTYQIIERINSYLLKVKDEDKEYLCYDFNDNKEGFFDFKFAYKRLKGCGLTLPIVYALDKKNYRALVELIEGATIFEELCNHDLDEKVIEEVFNANYKARMNRLRLDFDPHKFIYKNEKLYYLPFTFTSYIRDEDFTQKELRLWFYTNEFKKLLIDSGLPIDQSRLKNEYERNKEIVLLVVKYFK